MVHDNKKCGFRFKHWWKNMVKAKVLWSGKVNIEKIKKTSQEEAETD